MRKDSNSDSDCGFADYYDKDVCEDRDVVSLLFVFLFW
jgi:hypothetical protein